MTLDSLNTGYISTHPGIDWGVYEIPGELGTPLPGTKANCVMCRKEFVVPLYSGEYDPVCSECFTTYIDTAKVVCAYCHSFVGRIAPGEIECGYVVQPRAILHTSRCGLCLPDIKESTILEIDRWIKYVREPVIYTAGGKPAVVRKKIT